MTTSDPPESPEVPTPADTRPSTSSPSSSSAPTDLAHASGPSGDPADAAEPGRDAVSSRPVVRAFLGLGSNLGDRLRYLRDAVLTLRDVGLVAVSPVYETDPVGGPVDQDRYLNLVVELHTDRTPHELLGVCRRLEAAAGRLREERWGPRTLDVDVLWVEGQQVDDDDLTVPHPRLWERRFVVAPLHDLAPDVADDNALAASEGLVEPRGLLDEL